MQTRPITEADLPACVSIYNESLNDLHRRFGFLDEVSNDDSWLLAPLRHLLLTDPAGGRIAFDDDGEVAFASTLVRDRYWFLAFLFVRPRTQRRGVGRRLLGELLPADADITRATVVESFQGVATGLYASGGMTPARSSAGSSVPARVDLTADRTMQRADMTDADLDSIGQLDERVLGFRRRKDHEWWIRTMRAFAYRRGKAMVAYAYLDEAYVAPVLAVDPATLEAVIADLFGSVDGGALELGVWSSSPALLRSLLHAGFRIHEAKVSLVYASSGGPLPANYMANADWLP
jgi:GNAT superfamily N-acetyltransferase